jgi:hypothetical protein
MNIGWPDLPGALLMLAAGLLIVAALVGLVVWDARRRRSPAVVIDVAGAIARVWVAFTGVFVVLSFWRWFGGDVWIPDMPVVVEAPELSCGDLTEPIAATTPTLVCGSIGTADVTIAGIDFGMRLMLAAGDLLALLVVATPGVVLAVACSKALQGVPFARSVSRWLLTGAVVVFVAGVGSELLSSMGRTILSKEVFPPTGADVTSSAIYYVGVSFWPIGAAFALAALGAIFRHGERLQKDTEALV